MLVIFVALLNKSSPSPVTKWPSIIFGMSKFPDISFLYLVSTAELSSIKSYSQSSVFPTTANSVFISFKLESR